MASPKPPHFEHIKLGWMIHCCFLISSSHPTQQRFNKEDANSSKKDTWKGQPSKKNGVSMMPFFHEDIGDRKSSPCIQGRKQLWAFFRKRNCFSVRCPRSLEACLPSPFFCLPTLAQTLHSTNKNLWVDWQADAFKWQSSYSLFFSFSVQLCG